MQCVHDVMSLLAVEGVAGTLTAQLQCTGTLAKLAIKLLCHAHISNALSLTACVEGIVSFLFLGGTCIFVQLRVSCHGLPVAAGRLASAGQVDRAYRVLQQWRCW